MPSNWICGSPIFRACSIMFPTPSASWTRAASDRKSSVTPKEVLEFDKKNDAKQLDLRFTDIPSLQHHVSYSLSELDESSFVDGFGMDGSSIRGWAAIHESDMLLIPDPETALMDPFAETPTLI